MYHDGQIVYDVTYKRPTIAYRGSHRTTHFLHAPNEQASGETNYEIALPKSVKEAIELMDQGKIFPAPLPQTHCHKCFNWKTNHNKDGSCWR